ncbi:hypothetical protein AAFN88_05445 [Pelagibius sp. CAU 1746]|uniref:hypothetical protein n=1 Tax=Pelagibius sp. CAU 1746 TaxID=3140370 RepID=UPI00325B478F
MWDRLILDKLKLDGVKRLARDDGGAAVMSYAFIAACVVVASFILVRLAGAGSDRLLHELFYFISLD